MGTEVRVLVVGRGEDPAGPLLHELERSGFEVRPGRVESARAAGSEVAGGRWDLVLACAGPEGGEPAEVATEVAAVDPDLPVLVVGGGLETARAAVRAGARDWLAEGRVALAPEIVRRELEAARVRRELRESDERFRLAFEMSPDPMTITRLEDGVYVAVNRATEEATGVPRERLLGRSIVELGFWAEPGARERFVAELGEHGRVRNMEAAFRIRGGEVRVGLVSAAVFEHRGERHIFAMVKDVTESARVRRALEESEARYRRFFELELTCNFITARDRIVDCNRTFVETFGFASKEEALTTPVRELYPSHEDRERFLDRLRRERVVRGEEREYVRRDGTRFPVLEGAVGVFGEDGSLVGVQGFLLDLSERKELEARLERAQRLESLGRLAAGVAHDFNNVLQAVSVQLDLLRLERQDPAVHRRAGEARRAVERGARLTRQLLAFSRQDAAHPRPLDLARLVGEMVTMLRSLVGEEVRLELRLPEEVLPVIADPAQLEQVVMNLVVNARDATPPGGRIIVSVRAVRSDGGFTAARPWARHRAYAVLEVADTGCGMPPEVRERVFEPFFTTKDRGRGTGLGLATVYGIVAEHGGMIELASEPGRGSVFSVYLPLAEGSGLATERTGRRQELPRGGGETVLLAEDDPAVRRSVAQALGAAGYRVLAAADGEEAVRLFGRHAEEVAVAVLDVMMPGLTGDRVAVALRRVAPGLPVVFLSGYAGDALEERVRLPRGARVLHKPAAVAELVREVRAALEERGGEGGGG